MLSQRAELLDRLRSKARWDVLVIGGGATGLGTAVDAAARGLATLLLEARDFAQGTSSRSTKLIHGGVRYLASGKLALVSEALSERSILLRNAPHLVHDLEFIVPAYSWWRIPYYGLGLKFYDVLAGRHGLIHSRMLSRESALRRVPNLRAKDLRGGISYHDGQFDDARLAISLYRTVLDLGGTALNHMPVVALTKTHGRISGVLARNAESDEEFSIAARAVVNASGVFSDGIRRLDDPQAQPLIQPSQGAHVVLDRSFLPGSSALMVPRTDDGRVLFAIPWHDHVLVGTTDTTVERVEFEPRPFFEEVEFLLRHVARYLERPPRLEDVRSMFAGLRPLLNKSGSRATARLSREHAVFVSPSGLITISGGKWTTYRRMGADAVACAIALAGLSKTPSRTESLLLHGAGPRAEGAPLSDYGSDADDVASLIAERPEWGERIAPSLLCVVGEVVWATRHEAARTVEDVLSRRTRALFLDARASREAAPRVAEIMAQELGRDEAWRVDQIKAFQTLAQRYLPDAP
jgi:glycerol-3-phosphate dehydrogenase